MMSASSKTWRHLLIAAAAQALPKRALGSTVRLVGNDAAAACAVARQLGPAALCRQTDFHGWTHLTNGLLVASPHGLGEFALWLVGFYHGRVEITGPVPDYLLNEPAEGFGVRRAEQDPTDILHFGGYLGTLFRPDAAELVDLAQSCNVPILPLRATVHKARFRLDIRPPIPAAADTFRTLFPIHG